MIKVAVAAEENLNLRRAADRAHDPCDAFHIRSVSSARIGKAAAAPVKLRLGNARDVAVGDNAKRADLVKHIRDRHPGDIDVVGPATLRQGNPCHGYSNQKKKSTAGRSL
jgi:hypothetical protein